MASCNVLEENSVDLNVNEEETLFEIVWYLLDERRDLLYDLFDAVRSLCFKKTGKNSNKSPLDQFANLVSSLDPRLQEVNISELEDVLLLVESNPPPPLPCPFEDVLLELSNDGVCFKNHDKISVIFSFLDVNSLLALSVASKKTYYATKVYMNKELYNLPFNRESICSNLIFWTKAIDFFFRLAGTLKPIDRNKYTPITKQVNSVKSTFPISLDSMSSHVYFTIDLLKPHYIAYCNHEKPMSHTCSSSNAFDCENRVTTKIISCADFVSEYFKRLELKDDQIVSGFNTECVSSKHIALLFKHYLETIGNCINKHNGKTEFSRTEFIANYKHGIVHRIWVQVSLKWEFRYGTEPQNSLYLTIADHFRLDV